jgi:hypothetical protein
MKTFHAFPGRTSDKACVLVERQDTLGTRKNRRREEYSLNRTPDGWKITTVRIVAK